MRKIIKTLIFATILLTVITSANAARGDYKEFYQGQTIDNLVINFMEANHIPGLSLAIVQSPYITRVVGYGLANTDSKRLVATNTVFNVGQITTAFTAVAIMQLVEAGKLHLNDPVSRFIPNLPQDWQSITIRELISHSSGIPNYADKLIGFDYSQTYTPNEIINLIKDKPLLFKPGTQVADSATDYYLLAMVIAKASGMSYEEYITKNQFERLHLNQTYFISTMKLIKNEVNDTVIPFNHNQFKQNAVYINPTEPATGYSEIEGKLMEAKPLTEAATLGNADLVSTARDISTWDIALASNILIKNIQDRDFLYHAITLKNGIVVPANAGWLFPGHKGYMYIKGNVPGFTSFLGRFTVPSELVCVTLLANKDDVLNMEILGRQIAAAYDTKLAVPTGAAWTVIRQSPYSVPVTIDRMEAAIQQQGGKIFARIDHSANAAKAGEKLDPMQVLVFGNPSKGTGLLAAQNAIALDLPLRAMAWQDKNGEVWLSFINPIKLGKAYGVKGQNKLLKQMYYALSKAAKKATSAY